MLYSLPSLSLFLFLSGSPPPPKSIRASISSSSVNHKMQKASDDDRIRTDAPEGTSLQLDILIWLDQDDSSRLAH